MRSEVEPLPGAFIALLWLGTLPPVFKRRGYRYIWKAVMLPLCIWLTVFYLSLSVARASVSACFSGVGQQELESFECGPEAEGLGVSCSCLTFRPIWATMLFNCGIAVGGIVVFACYQNEVIGAKELVRYLICEDVPPEDRNEEEYLYKVQKHAQELSNFKTHLNDCFKYSQGRIVLDFLDVSLSLMAIIQYLFWTHRYVHDKENAVNLDSWQDFTNFISIGFYISMILHLFSSTDSVRQLRKWKHQSIFFSSSLLVQHLLLIVLDHSDLDHFLVTFTKQNGKWRAANFLEPYLYIRIWRLIAPVHHILKNNTQMENVNRHQVEVLVAIISIIFSSAGTIFMLEFSMLTLKLSKFTDAAYFIMTTVSTVGFGDYAPETTAGRVFMSFFLVVIISFLPNQFQKIEQLRQQARIFKRYNDSRVTSRKEQEVVLITGHIDPEITMPLLNEMLHPEHYRRNLRILLFVDAENVDDTARAMIQDKRFRGRVAMMESIKNGSDISRAIDDDIQACFVLSNPNAKDQTKEDNSLLMRAIVLRKNCKARTPVFVQCLRPRTKLLLEASGADFLWSQREVAQAVVARSSLCPGFSTLIINLLRTASFDGNETTPWLKEYDHSQACEVYGRPFSPNLFGFTFAAVSSACHKNLLTRLSSYGGMVTVTLFAMRIPCKACKQMKSLVAEHGHGCPDCKVILNPKSSHIIREGYVGFFICQDEGDLDGMEDLELEEVSKKRASLLSSRASTGVIIQDIEGIALPEMDKDSEHLVSSWVAHTSQAELIVKRNSGDMQYQSQVLSEWLRGHRRRVSIENGSVQTEQSVASLASLKGFTVQAQVGFTSSPSNSVTSKKSSSAPSIASMKEKYFETSVYRSTFLNRGGGKGDELNRVNGPSPRSEGITLATISDEPSEEEDDSPKGNGGTRTSGFGFRDAVKRVIWGRRAVKRIQEMALQRRVSPDFFKIEADAPAKTYFRKRAQWRDLENGLPADRRHHIVIFDGGDDLEHFIHPLRGMDTSMPRSVLVVQSVPPANEKWSLSPEGNIWRHKMYQNCRWLVGRASDWTTLHQSGVHRAWRIIVMPGGYEMPSTNSSAHQFENLDDHVIPAVMMLRLFIQTVRDFVRLVEHRLVEIRELAESDMTAAMSNSTWKADSFVMKMTPFRTSSRRDHRRVSCDPLRRLDQGAGEDIVAAVQENSSMVYLDESSWRPLRSDASSLNNETFKAPVFASGRVCPLNMFHFLMCQAYFNGTTADLFDELIFAGSNLVDHDTSVINQVLIPSKYVGKEYCTLFHDFVCRNVIVLALYRHGSVQNSQLPYVLTNPRPDTIIYEDDKAIALIRRDDLIAHQDAEVSQ